MTALPELVLGTVQFGRPYGVASAGGPPGEDEVRRVLDRARTGGVRRLDTAPVYGEAEALLGRLGAGERFGLISKIPALGPAAVDEPDSGSVSGHIETSCRRLGVEALDAVLFHDADDLLRRDGERLWQAACTSRASRRVGRVGVSVYEIRQLRALLDRFPLEIVQLPFNLFDGRFAESGLLQELAARDVAVHARSVFLQGVLLMAPSALPEWLDGLRAVHADFHRWAAEIGAAPITVALAAACAQPGIDALVVGCRSASELGEVLAALEKARAMPEVGRDALDRFRLHHEPLLDPRTWPAA